MTNKRKRVRKHQAKSNLNYKRVAVPIAPVAYVQDVGYVFKSVTQSKVTIVKYKLYNPCLMIPSPQLYARK